MRDDGRGDLHEGQAAIENRGHESREITDDSAAELRYALFRLTRRLRSARALDAMSDAQLAEVLSREGVKVARRTVAKYREALGLASSSERRQATARASA